MTTDASLALAVGRRIHPEREWREDAGVVEWSAILAFATSSADANGTASPVVWLPYNPLVGADAAEAEVWLWERCWRVDVQRRMGLHRRGVEVSALPCVVMAWPLTGGSWREWTGATPAEARARIIAAWPGGEG